MPWEQSSLLRHHIGEAQMERIYIPFVHCKENFSLLKHSETEMSPLLEKWVLCPCHVAIPHLFHLELLV